ncbi:hypothetical protein GWI33_005311 [Rhynchophorus ferrugineus]|uniref:Uncharacterized protein n=1 Tax=Rhynchophorus ferrugineus TaxID=354439 RepID=A0A834IK86_RHYFE|nr:hypothetical protein GWI33_005311 [Rhynchophorus ferrugineus]
MNLLLCYEPTTENVRAIKDPALLKPRVLLNLLKAEDRYVLPYPHNISSVQTDVTPAMRKIVAEWMMENHHFYLNQSRFAVISENHRRLIEYVPSGGKYLFGDSVGERIGLSEEAPPPLNDNLRFYCPLYLLCTVAIYERTMPVKFNSDILRGKV